MAKKNGFGFVFSAMDRSGIVLPAPQDAALWPAPRDEDLSILFDAETLEAVDALLLEERMLGIPMMGDEPFVSTIH